MEKIDAETIHDIIKKLVGEISPIGCASRDPERLENLKTLCGLSELIMQKIYSVYYNHKESYEGSVKEISKCAEDYIKETIENLT